MLFTSRVLPLSLPPFPLTVYLVSCVCVLSLSYCHDISGYQYVLTQFGATLSLSLSLYLTMHGFMFRYRISRLQMNVRASTSARTHIQKQNEMCCLLTCLPLYLSLCSMYVNFVIIVVHLL